MRTSDRGIAFLAAHEGIVPGPYLDSVGVWTYGVGHTAAAGAPTPRDMPRGLPANIDAGVKDALAVFKRDLAKYEADVERALGGVQVGQHEFDAAVSFHFNTGAIARAEWVKLWKGGRKADAAASMLANWRKPAEILPRRTAERDLFLRGTYGVKPAAVWPVNSVGRITWKPIRTFSQSQLLALMGYRAVPVYDMSTDTTDKSPFSAILALIKRLFGG